jgi:hypothetical protein
MRKDTQMSLSKRTTLTEIVVSSFSVRLESSSTFSYCSLPFRLEEFTEKENEKIELFLDIFVLFWCLVIGKYWFAVTN